MFTNILNKIDFFRKILINTFFIIFLLGIFLFLLITPFLGDSTDKKKSILFLDASSQMSNNSSFFSKSYGLSNYEIINAIEIAEKDNEIETILIDVSLMNLSATDASEIGESLVSFRSTGKKVITYGDFYFQNQYLLASYSDEIILNPFGLVYLEGYKNLGKESKQWLLGKVGRVIGKLVKSKDLSSLYLAYYAMDMIIDEENQYGSEFLTLPFLDIKIKLFG